MIHLDNNWIIDEILRGDDTALTDLLPRYEAVFMHAIRPAWRNTFDEATLEEAYLEAIANFYIRVKTGKLSNLEHSIESYLIATGKYWLIREAKRQNRNVPIDNSMDNIEQDEEGVLEDITASEVGEERQNRLLAAMAKMGKMCRKLLELSFVEEKTADDIMDIMKYSNLNTVYATKARCIKDLKKLINK